MDGSKIGIPEGESHEGSDTVNKIKQILIDSNSTKISYYLIQSTNECNNCRGKPLINNHMNIIADKGATKKH